MLIVFRTCHSESRSLYIARGQKCTSQGYFEMVKMYWEEGSWLWFFGRASFVLIQMIHFCSQCMIWRKHHFLNGRISTMREIAFGWVGLEWEVSRNFQDSKCFKVCFLLDFTCSRITNLDNSMGASPGFPVWCLIFFLPELLCNHIMLSKLGQWERIS